MLQRADAQRAERKEAILRFLSAAEEIETLRARVAYDEHQPADADVADLTHALWLAKKLIELVCSAEVAQVAQEYTKELDRCTWKLKRSEWKGASPALSRGEHELRVRFMEAARRELGYRGEPLRGRTRSNGPVPSELVVHEAPVDGERPELPQPAGPATG